MGLLDFDLDKVLQNPAFMLGMNIHGANTGNYGQLGPALSGGMNNYAQQQQQMMQQKMFLDKYKQQQADNAAIRKFTGGQPLDLYKLKNPSPNAEIQKYNLAKEQGFSGSFMDYQTAIKKAGATNVTTNVNNRELTPYQKERDKKAAGDNYTYETGGGQDQEKLMNQLHEVRKRLQSGDNLTGWWNRITPDAALTIFNPEAIDTREMVEESVQRNLRAVLGAQFTEKEGERLISRAFNPSLDENQNLARLNRLIAQMEAAHAAKQDAIEYANKNGTLAGWNGKQFTFQDFHDALDEVERHESSGGQRRGRYNPQTGQVEW